MTIEIPAHQLLAEKKLQGCSMGSNRFRVDMPRFVDFYLAGKLHLDDMLATHRARRRERRAAEAQDRRSRSQVISFG